MNCHIHIRYFLLEHFLTVAYYIGFFLKVNTLLRNFPKYFIEGDFMDSIIDRIRAICEEKNIPVSQLERDLGFGNGFLNPKKVDDIKTGRLFAILDYLGVSKAEFFGLDSTEAKLEEAENKFFDELQSMKDDENFRNLMAGYKKMKSNPDKVRIMKKFMDSLNEEDENIAN